MENQKQKLSRREVLKLGAAGLGSILVPPPVRRLVERSASASEFASRDIDGVETFGHEKPLNQEDFNALISSLNQKYENGETEMLPDVLYASMLVRKQTSPSGEPLTYDVFEAENGETYQNFLVRHIEEMDRSHLEANKYIGSLGNKVAGVRLRRVIVVDENVATSHSESLGYLDEGLKDSDGWWGLWQSEPYRPFNSGWYIEELNLDMAYNHEWEHAISKQPDHYALDYYPSSTQAANTLLELISENPLVTSSVSRILGVPEGEVVSQLESINESEIELNQETISSDDPFYSVPEYWQFYRTGYRQRVYTNEMIDLDPNGRNIMNFPDSRRQSSFKSWMASKTLETGTLHNFEFNVANVYGFPNDIPETVYFKVGDEHNGSKVRIFRTGGEFTNKSLNLVSESVIQDGECEVGNLLEGALETEERGSIFSANNGTFFMRVDTSDSENKTPHYIWFDVRDLATALEMLDRPTSVRFKNFPLASAELETAFDEIDWTRMQDVEAVDETFIPRPEPPEPKKDDVIYRNFASLAMKNFSKDND